MSNDNVLRPTGNAGQFVKDSQGTASEQGFSCVSRFWYPKTQALGDGIAAIDNQKRSRKDIMATFKDMSPRINGVGELVIEHKPSGEEYKPTEYALKHIAGKAGGIPQTYVNWAFDDVETPAFKYKRDAADIETALSVINNGWRRQKQDEQFLFRCYADGTLRAILTDSYAIIDNVWYLETLANLFKTIGGDEPRLSHWRGDADTIFGNLLLPDTVRAEKDSDFGGMLSLSNCEIGKRRLSQYPSVFSAICMNGCIWDRNKGNVIDKVHRGKIDYKLLSEAIVDNIHKQIPLLEEGVQRFLKCKDLYMPKDVKKSQIFAQMAIDNKLQPKVARMVVEEYVTHEQEHNNLYGLINAITRAGQKLSPMEWVALDEIGGDYMAYNLNSWERFTKRAGLLDQDKVNDMLKVAV